MNTKYQTDGNLKQFRNNFEITRENSSLKLFSLRYWWLRIQTLGEQAEWSELEKFSKSKKSPVGYAPFVDVCLKYDNTSEAIKYLPKVREDLKIKYYVKTK